MYSQSMVLSKKKKKIKKSEKEEEKTVNLYLDFPTKSNSATIEMHPVVAYSY